MAEARELTTEERDRATAEAVKHQAEAEKHRAEARKFSAEANEAEANAALAKIELERAEEKRRRELHADAYKDRTYVLGGVDAASVAQCMAKLDAWHREDPTCSMMVTIDSPGGAVIPGFHLFDHILALRADGHQIDTRTRGYAASMGGILLQAGETRSMGPNATLMIHEVAFGAQGKIGDVEDWVDFAKLLWGRALDIFAERCAGADDEVATKRLSRRALDSKSRRTNWWIKATDALAFGLVDKIQ